MRQLVVKTQDFQWIDIVEPKRDELAELAEEFEIASEQLQESMDRSHLPKYENRGKWHFAILRNFDDEADDEADTIQELTRKIAIFYSDKVLITIHRKDQNYLSKLKKQWSERKPQDSKSLAGTVMGDIFSEVLASYVKPIDSALEKIDEYETKIFLGSDVPKILEALYYLKRKSSIYRRMLRIHGELLKQSAVDLKFSPAKVAALKDDVERVFFHADTLQESTMHLFNAHVSISSQKTNEVMRVLTIFSVYFMPLTFIVGVYGMNFQHMPELAHPLGYLYVWLAMFVTCVGLGLWFRSRGWLRSEES